jgi:hypothetical protein
MAATSRISSSGPLVRRWQPPIRTTPPGIFTDAERLANSIADESAKAWALSSVAQTLAATSS